MKVPAQIKLRETAHGHGAKGMAFYDYEDAEGLGIQMQARRENGRSPFIETWFFEYLPDRRFETFAALASVLTEMTDEQIEAEASKYPRFSRIEPDTCGNRCRLCPRPAYDPNVGRVKHETWRVQVAKGWRASTDWFCSLCDDHLAQFDGKPAELVEALKKEVEERKSRNRAAAALADAGGRDE